MKKLLLALLILCTYAGNSQTRDFSKDEVTYIMENSLRLLKGVTKTMYKGIKARSYHRTYEESNGNFTTLFLEETTSYKMFSFSDATELFTQSATFKNGNEKAFEYTVYLYKTDGERASKFYSHAVIALTRNMNFEEVAYNTYKNGKYTVTFTQFDDSKVDPYIGHMASDRWVKAVFQKN